MLHLSGSFRKFPSGWIDIFQASVGSSDTERYCVLRQKSIPHWAKLGKRLRNKADR